MARRMDLQIFWVVVLAAIVWVAVWQHDSVSEFFRKTHISEVLDRIHLR